MNKYLISIRVKGHILKTVVFADSAYHAQLIFEYLFGFSNVVGKPTQISHEDNSLEMLDEVAKFIKPIKPMNAKQLMLNTLKKQKDQAVTRLKIERDRQKLVKNQKKLFTLSN
jgi:hypothetical protein